MSANSSVATLNFRLKSTSGRALLLLLDTVDHEDSGFSKIVLMVFLGVAGEETSFLLSQKFLFFNGLLYLIFHKSY